jgi:hypothetical protein
MAGNGAGFSARRNITMKKLLLVTVFAAIPNAAFAQQGTAQDAKVQRW